MPKVLELKPLKKKNLKLVMVESEFPIDWWFEAPKNLKDDYLRGRNLISAEYVEVIEGLIEKFKPDFGVVEKPVDGNVSPNQADPLQQLFKSKGLPFGRADIDENAQDYLSAALEEHRTTIKNLDRRVNEIVEKAGKVPENNEFFERLVLWKEYIAKDYEEQENEVRYNVREAWMMMEIMNLAKKVEGNKLKGLFVCDVRHFNGIEKLASDLNVDVQKIKIKRTIKTEEVERLLEKDIEIAL